MSHATAQSLATYPKVAPRIALAEQRTWQAQMTQLIGDVDALCAYVGLDKAVLQDVYHLPDKFPLKVPHAFANKIRPRLDDPLLLQILPSKRELDSHAGFSLDPLAETAQNPIKGLLHKYQSRVLITLTGVCAVHCRYCFRQHFDYHANVPTTDDLRAICEYIRQDENICEVLFSGGDPLNVNNRRLGLWLDALSDLPNIKTLRFHTRLPVVLPDRVDDELLALFKKCKKPIVMVLHINHAQEIDEHLAEKCRLLKDAGVTLLNQSVLLKGVNDNADTLAVLSHALFDIGVLPYYLHMLDKVVGAGHFLVEEERAIALYWELLSRVAGYLVPKLVQELPHELNKTPVDIYKYKD